jgi:hypothetical protein
VPYANCYSYLAESISKSNNSVKVWFNSFSSTLNVIHPNIWKCIEAFKKEISLNEIHVKQFIVGHSMGVRRKYKDFAERLKNVCDNLG